MDDRPASATNQSHVARLGKTMPATIVQRGNDRRAFPPVATSSASDRIVDPMSMDCSIITDPPKPHSPLHPLGPVPVSGAFCHAGRPDLHRRPEVCATPGHSSSLTSDGLEA